MPSMSGVDGRNTMVPHVLGVSGNKPHAPSQWNLMVHGDNRSLTCHPPKWLQPWRKSGHLLLTRKNAEQHRVLQLPPHLLNVRNIRKKPAKVAKTAPQSGPSSSKSTSSPTSGVTGVPRAAAVAAPNKKAQGQEKPATGRKKVVKKTTLSNTSLPAKHTLRSALHDKPKRMASGSLSGSSTASTRHKAKVFRHWINFCTHKLIPAPTWRSKIITLMSKIRYWNLLQLILDLALMMM